MADESVGSSAMSGVKSFLAGGFGGICAVVVGKTGKSIIRE